MYVCMYVCMYVYMYACMHVYMYLCMYAYLSVCLSVCMYVCPSVCLSLGLLFPPRFVSFFSSCYKSNAFIHFLLPSSSPTLSQFPPLPLITHLARYTISLSLLFLRQSTPENLKLGTSFMR